MRPSILKKQNFDLFLSRGSFSAQLKIGRHGSPVTLSTHGLRPYSGPRSPLPLLEARASAFSKRIWAMLQTPYNGVLYGLLFCHLHDMTGVLIEGLLHYI